jgi:hypothetical protein
MNPSRFHEYINDGETGIDAAFPHKDGRGTVSLVRITLWFGAKRSFHE